MWSLDQAIKATSRVGVALFVIGAQWVLGRLAYSMAMGLDGTANSQNAASAVVAYAKSVTPGLPSLILCTGLALVLVALILLVVNGSAQTSKAGDTNE